MQKGSIILGILFFTTSLFAMSFAQENDDRTILFEDNFSNEGAIINDEIVWTGRYSLPDISAIVEDSIALVRGWRKIYTTPTFDHSESWIKYSAVIVDGETSSTVSTHPVFNGNVSTGFGVSVVFENGIATVYGNNLGYISQRTELSYDLTDFEGDLHVEIFQNALNYSVRLSKGAQFDEFYSWTATRSELASDETVLSLSSKSSASFYDNVLIELTDDPRTTEIAWLFEENSGAVATDISGEYIISAFNTDWGDGQNGTALVFNSDDNYADVSSLIPQFNDFASKQGAVEIWAKIGESTAKQYLFHAIDLSSGNEIELYYSETDQMRFVFHDWEHRILLTESVSGVSANDGLWHQFIISWNIENEMQLYIDGELVGSKEISDLQQQKWTPDFDYIIIGADATYFSSHGIFVQELNGSIDNFSLINTVIQSSQAQARYFEKLENSTLPVELLDFNINIEQKSVFLNWVTASEINNDYFTIQRSTDFKEWENVGKISGFGNSTDLKYYQFVDNSPVVGLSYYRLKQTDFDGVTEIFDAKSINYNSDEQLKLELISTNYLFGKMEIQYLTDNLETVSISVFSINGSLISTTNHNPSAGINLVDFDVNCNGVCIIKINQSNQVVTEKVYIR
ncbi:MAG: T9SS type A sorting domain-containing protein [Bacteroidales bacterium]|nr:T9SS type A sorting domain-containing protein [Bacteroidales bacterium]